MEEGMLSTAYRLESHGPVLFMHNTPGAVHRNFPSGTHDMNAYMCMICMHVWLTMVYRRSVCWV